ncbi:transcriptional regulator, DeoR family [Vibrio parahaemolyticus AQ3810]|nr:transcriptional regulator, DeoR family [Vibrio parahaemolyticus AQ3810]
MSKRNTQLRRHAISNMVNELGEVSVDELAQKFETSEVTIRKDLASLEKNGQLLRRYGGAIAIPTEVIHEELSSNVSTRKLSLAAAASGTLIPFTLKKFNIDPAVAGSVVLTTVTDVVGFFAFLGLGAIFLI